MYGIFMSWSEDYHVEPEEFGVDHRGGGLTENLSVRTVVEIKHYENAPPGRYNVIKR